jgi:hypothetical protein
LIPGVDLAIGGGNAPLFFFGAVRFSVHL